jgi:hypothetical protein
MKDQKCIQMKVNYINFYTFIQYLFYLSNNIIKAPPGLIIIYECGRI